jgi:uncharacterized membrane protein YphA (DoxX/SURF4 family)
MAVTFKTPVVAATTTAGKNWPVAGLIAFRFVFAYFLLYKTATTFFWLPYDRLVGKQLDLIWHSLVPWVAKHILSLHKDITVFTNGSGDTTYNYVQILCLLMFASIATGVWTILDRNRKEYSQLYEWLRMFVSFLLAGTLLTYGITKLGQFSVPAVTTLLEPYGNSSPMALLWTFIGASRSYCIFAGFAEVLPGILLLFPPLRTLGAVIAACTLTNVFMLNMCYDVPVKLFSLHLLLMSLAILAPDLKRFFNFFVLNRPVEPRFAAPLFKNAIPNKIILFVQILVAIYLIVTPINYMIRQGTEVKVASSHSLYGIWGVNQFSSAGQQTIPDSLKWQRLVFEESEGVSVLTADNKLNLYYGEIDSKVKKIELRGMDQSEVGAPPELVGKLSFTQPDDKTLILDGTYAGKQVHAILHHQSTPEFLLLNRGFHWIQEHPFQI